jgi:tetratricopeptide (TPR) repeat protein
MIPPRSAFGAAPLGGAASGPAKPVRRPLLNRLRSAAVVLLAASVCSLAAAQALRPEVAKPLQQAGELLKVGKSKEALAKVREADAVPNKTAAEQLTIDRMRGAAAQRAGDHATTIQAFEAVYASGKLSAAEQAQVAESLAYAYAQTKDVAKAQAWIARAQAAGGNSAQLKALQAYLQGQSGDYAAIARDAAAAVSTAEQSGQRPAEADLLRLVDAYQHSNNPAYGAALEKLLAYYPKKEYWAATLARLPRKPGFADRYALDVMRLKLASGTMSRTDDFMEMAQLALQAGYPAEAKKIVERGYAAGALGSGAEAERHKRLRDLALKQDAESSASIAARASEATAAKDGNALVQAGYVYVTLGETDKGIALIEQGITKGGLKRPEDAKLRLGMAQLQSPKGKAKAMQTLRSVQGSDGSADIARLWVLLGNP